MYEITITVIAPEGQEASTIALKTASRSNARAIVLLAQENADTISAVATKMSAPRIVKFKGVGDATPPAPVQGKKGK